MVWFWQSAGSHSCEREGLTKACCSCEQLQGKLGKAGPSKGVLLVRAESCGKVFTQLGGCWLVEADFGIAAVMMGRNAIVKVSDTCI